MRELYQKNKLKTIYLLRLLITSRYNIRGVIGRSSSAATFARRSMTTRLK
jgi:hypothetical protein